MPSIQFHSFRSQTLLPPFIIPCHHPVISHIFQGHADVRRPAPFFDSPSLFVSVFLLSFDLGREVLDRAFFRSISGCVHVCRQGRGIEHKPRSLPSREEDKEKKMANKMCIRGWKWSWVQCMHLGSLPLMRPWRGTEGWCTCQDKGRKVNLVAPYIHTVQHRRVTPTHDGDICLPTSR